MRAGGPLVPGVSYDDELNASPSDGDGNGEPVQDLGAFEYD